MKKLRVSTNHASYLTNQPAFFYRKAIVSKFVAGILVISATSCNFFFNRPTEWFAFKPNDVNAESVIDMSSWLDSPAGKHGFVLSDSSNYVFEDGEPVKFWGVNICSQRPYSPSDTVDKWVSFLSKYGINAIRFHKYTDHGFPENVSTQIDPEKQKSMDYFQSELKKRGIYFGWSPIYGHKVRPGDSASILAYSEIASADMNSHLSFSTIGLVNFSEDLQDLHIELFRNMLEHRNPFTGLRYADDPALAFIEIQNEDDIWFATTDRMLEMCPTYKKVLTNKFSSWLKEKYGNQEGLKNAWGDKAFDWGKEVYETTWNLDKGNICPSCSHGIYAYEYEKAMSNGEALPLFLRDMAYFLYLQQQNYYDRLSDAIRETGYKGPIIGSCWQAGAGVSHYLNLLADYKTGPVDRHNYFGGGTGHRLVPGRFNNSAMISSPGSGLLNTGRQSVAGRPFQFSEWMSLMPNEWIAEGPPIIAIYGLGLQGWDASYSFASDFTGFTSTIHTPGVYNINSPTQAGLYPPLAAMIYRNEIKEGDAVAEMNVNLESLRNGVVGFNEMVRQDRDQKEISGGIPNAFFAAGKVELNFTPEFKETKIPPVTDYIDTLHKTIRSTTEQLFWDYSGKGYFTASTAFSKVVTGFTDNKLICMDDVKMRIANDFAVVILTSLDRKLDLAKTDRALLTVMARAKNTGMEFNEDMTELTEPGHAPILLEPVSLNLKFGRRKIKELIPLDHSGCRTQKRQPVNSGSVLINGNKFKTIYYEIILE